MRRNLRLVLATGALALACGEVAPETIGQKQAALGAASPQLSVYTEWADGYCAMIDNPDYAWDGSTWTALVELGDAEAFYTWNGTFDTSSSPMEVTGQWGSPGYCANKTGPDWQPQLVADPDPEVDLSACYESTANRAAVDGEVAPPDFVLASGSTWHYTFSPPAADWNSENFDDSSWQTGPAGFYLDPGAEDVLGTPWPQEAPQLWARATFELTASDIPDLVMWGRWDDTMAIYVNGVPTSSFRANGQDVDEWSSDYKHLGFSRAARAALRPGTNTIAVNVTDTGGGKYFDLGIGTNSALTHPPMTGFALTPALDQYSEAVEDFMIENGIPSASISVMKEDTVVLSRSFGWMDKQLTVPIVADPIMRLASNDKPLGAAALRHLIDSGFYDPVTDQTITDSTLVFPLLQAYGLVPLPLGTAVDPRVYDITMRHLLRHREGLQQPDARNFYSEVPSIERGSETIQDNIGWVYAKPLKFAPGSQYSYSSTGHMVMRYVVEVLTGGFVDYLTNTALAGYGANDIRFAYECVELRSAREPWYATHEEPWERWIALEKYTALAASTDSLVRYMRAYDLWEGENWDTGQLVDANGEWSAAHAPSVNTPRGFGGRYAGTVTFQRQFLADELSYAIAFNIGVYEGRLAQRLDEISENLGEADFGL